MIIPFHEEFRDLQPGDNIVSNLGEGQVSGVMCVSNPGILGLNDCMIINFVDGPMKGRDIALRVKPKFIPSCFDA